MKRKILIISFGSLHNDPRILRQIESLKSEFQIIAAGYSNPSKGVEYIELVQHLMIDYFFKYPMPVRKLFALFTRVYLWSLNTERKLAKRIFKNSVFKTPAFYFEKEYWTKVRKENFKQLSDINPDVIIANDLHTLPLGVKLKKANTKLIFDAHEYYPGELEESAEWMKDRKPAVDYLCKKYLLDADIMLTVSDPIAREYKKKFNVNPVVLTNASAFQNLKAQTPGKVIKMIHHGAAMPGRLLEETIGVMQYLNDAYTLDVMLLPSDTVYLESLKKKYENDKRIRFIDPVPTEKICETINQYDIGVYILPPLNFNNTNALPNKFFEFIQARLAIAIGPMPAMAEIVNKFKLGVVADEYNSLSLSKAILKMESNHILEFKINSDKAAQILCADHNKALLSNIVAELINQREPCAA